MVTDEEQQLRQRLRASLQRLGTTIGGLQQACMRLQKVLDVSQEELTAAEILLKLDHTSETVKAYVVEVMRKFGKADGRIDVEKFNSAVAKKQFPAPPGRSSV